MPSLPFLNDNANRDYPFVVSTRLLQHSGGGFVELPRSAVVEAFVIVGVDVPFDPAQDRVYLYEIRRSGSTLWFVLKLTVADYAYVHLEFCRQLDDLEFATSYASDEIASGSSSTLDTAECPAFRAEGWLTTGNLQDLAALLADGETLRAADGHIYVEPARVQTLHASYLKSISLANQNRTLASGPETCSTPLADSSDYLTNRRCLDGQLFLREGYNVQISQDTRNNVITIGASLGGGQGQPCAEIILVEDEVPPTDSNVLSGGPTCNEVIKTLNGLPGPRVVLRPGAGVRIAVDEEDPHTLQLVVDFNGLAVCQE
jgi:hypothetical protein